ncbi:MAG TPA: RHS repeat-associated core domain-containing protein [Chlorobiota bacterium]|nr:RHS repeat-associated core domain-containing protein [Chlorobiota bacterium]
MTNNLITTGPDLHDQNANNYAYDNAGNMTKDVTAGINADGIVWTPYNKIRSITKAGSTPTSKLTYLYDASGNRVVKRYYEPSTTLEVTTWYVRDAQGNTMAIYTKPSDSTTARLTEAPIYGSSRIGVAQLGSLYSTSASDTIQNFGTVFPRITGARSYELTDHLGNVRATISDIAVKHGSDWDAELLTRTDYYPFGMIMDGRNEASGEHRYGYNGKENDNEVKGDGNQQDYGARIYDPRVGRWLSVYPAADEAPTWSPYRAFFDSPTNVIDSDGEREKRALLYAATYLRKLKSRTWTEIHGASFRHGTVPTQAVCNEIVYFSYRNITGDPYGKAGFGNRSRVGMFNWFKGGNGSVRRELITGREQTGAKIGGREYKVDFDRSDFDKIEEGDVLFMGHHDQGSPWTSNNGHVVLAVQVDQSRSTNTEVVVNVFGAYAHEDVQTRGIVDSQFETMKFTKTTITDENGRSKSAWTSSHSGYTLFGIGRVIQDTANPADGGADTSASKQEASQVPQRTP